MHTHKTNINNIIRHAVSTRREPDMI